MEEKRKLSTGVIILILTLIVALTSVTTILIYKEINNKNDNMNNQIKNNEIAQTNVENNINNSEQLNQTENKEENENQVKDDINSQENIVSRTTKVMKLNEKVCSIELKCINNVKNTQEIYSNYIIKVNNTDLQIQGEPYERYKEHQVSTLTDEETKKEYIILKIDALDGNDINLAAKYLNTTYYIINENAQIVDKIHISGFSAIIIDDENDTNHGLWCTTYIDIAYNDIVTYEYIEETKIGRCKYIVENGKFSREIIRIYNQDEFIATGRV